MTFRSITLYGLFLALVSCSGWSSELDTAFVEDQKRDEKPICAHKVENNCLSQSLKLILTCLPPVTAEPELLSEDEKKCNSASGKEILFLDDSLKAFINGHTETLRFIAYDGQKKCFEFIGNDKNFLVDSPEFGTIEVSTLQNGDVEVSCLFNDGFVIPSEAKTLGCRGQKAAAQDVAPSHNLSYKQNKDNAGGVVYDQFQFFFSGAGAIPDPVFRCQH